MMKIILLLAFAVLISSAHAQNKDNCSANRHDRNLLGELADNLEKAVKSFSEETKGKPIFLRELQMDDCKCEVFCLAEQELKTKVSGLSGAKFDLFRTDRKLMRNLNTYNKHHMKTCKPVDEDQNEMPLHEFLPKLLTCVKNEFSQAK